MHNSVACKPLDRGTVVHGHFGHYLEEPLERIAAVLAARLPPEPHADGVLHVIDETAGSSCRFAQVCLGEFDHGGNGERGESRPQAGVVEPVWQLEYPPAHDQPELSENVPPVETECEETLGGRPDVRGLLLVDHPNQLATHFKTPPETVTTRLQVGIIQIRLEVNLGGRPEEKLALHLVHVAERRELRPAEPGNFRSPSPLRLYGSSPWGRTRQNRWSERCVRFRSDRWIARRYAIWSRIRWLWPEPSPNPLVPHFHLLSGGVLERGSLSRPS